MTTTGDILARIDALPIAKHWPHVCADKKGNPSWGRWSVQRDAVKFAESYYAKDAKHHERAALIRMPTGTGKTGVMAIIANYLLHKKSCLIVVPSTYLTGQVMRALNGQYWERVNHRPPQPVPSVVFLPSDLVHHLNIQTAPTVFICTQKALADVYGVDATYGLLKSRISAVLVDEGHREPALTWARAIRAMEKSTILFSATPYRNDLRMFRIGRGKGYRFALRYQDALHRDLIRRVEFHEPVRAFITKDPTTGIIQRNANVFAADLLAFYRRVLLARKPDSVGTPRVIVRCDTAASIEEVQKALRREIAADPKPICDPEMVISIHQTFTNQLAQQKFTHPPKPGDAASQAVFWIHQFKLAEGIDNPDFCCVAFFEPYGNARSLVQQIGRIIRNPSGSRGEVAFVFGDAADRAESEWSGYVSFERAGQDVIGAEDIVHAIREAQPKWFYAGGRYREGIDFDGEDYWPDIRIPASAQIYVRPNGFGPADLRKLNDTIGDRIQERDVAHVRTLERRHSPFTASVTTFFWEVLQSEHFDVRSFFNVRLLLAHFYMNDKHIFYQGVITLDPATLGAMPQKISVENLLSAIPAKDVMLKEMSLVNSDLGDMAVRRKILGGRSLEQSSAALNDHLHFVAACVCSHNGKRRYIGLSHARVTDSVAKQMPLDQYHQWADTLSGELTTSTKHQNSILRRFATSVRTPTKAIPRHILLDLNAVDDMFDDSRIFADAGGAEGFDAVACEVDAAGKFECEVGGAIIHGTISYDGRRFKIISADLDALYTAKMGNRRSASSFVSSPEVLRVVTEDGLIYADGRFFRPLRLHGKDRLTDLAMFCPIPELHKITTGEKGDKGVIGATSWQDGSIFHAIDTVPSMFTNNDMNPDIVVCDDLSTEVADFVAIDTKQKKLVLIHAKEGRRANGIAAGDLHVVVSQAKKNLAFLDAAEKLPPKRGDKWDLPWRWKKGAAARLNRIRKHPSSSWDGRRIMQHIDSMRAKTDTQKEVWLVLGNMFGMTAIEKVITADGAVPYHWIQILYLIHSCHASVAAVGARLRILVGP